MQHKYICSIKLFIFLLSLISCYSLWLFSLTLLSLSLSLSFSFAQIIDERYFLMLLSISYKLIVLCTFVDSR